MRVSLCGKTIDVKFWKGQSVIRKKEDVENAWNYAVEGSRGDLQEVIVEGFIDFDYEITLLTVTQQNGKTLFCPPIGHRQERGDYQESWQPMPMDPVRLKEAEEMAGKVTKALGGAGIWGVEFFITKEATYFSELSPRPHDTGMVTLGKTQNLNEFELHARAILGIPIPEVKLFRNGASAVILAKDKSLSEPVFVGVEKALSETDTDVRLFGKPSTRAYRRMGVILKSGKEDVETLTAEAKNIASQVSVL